MNATVSYKNIFSDELKEMIAKKNESILDLSISKEKFYIDVVEIAKKLNLNINYIDYDDDHSGSIEDNKIFVNNKHHLNRQRFTIAHEIGHFLLNHSGENHRASSISFYSNSERANEKLANDIAANLLMPAIQVEALYSKFLEDNHLDEGSTLTAEQKDKLFNFMAEKLSVSKSATNYRLLNLGLI